MRRTNGDRNSLPVCAAGGCAIRYGTGRRIRRRESASRLNPPLVRAQLLPERNPPRPRTVVRNGPFAGRVSG